MNNSSLPNERELLIQLSQGNEKAFEKIYNSYNGRLYGYIFKISKSESIAKELVQDVFITIWDRRQSIDSEKTFSSYLYRIATNKVYESFRTMALRRKVHAQISKVSIRQYSHIEETLITKQNIQILNKVIDSLPPQRRQIFRLCKLNGYSYKEVSGKLGMTTSTISDHIVKANQHISKYFSYKF